MNLYEDIASSQNKYDSLCIFFIENFLIFLMNVSEDSFATKFLFLQRAMNTCDFERIEDYSARHYEELLTQCTLNDAASMNKLEGMILWNTV